MPGISDVDKPLRTPDVPLIQQGLTEMPQEVEVEQEPDPTDEMVSLDGTPIEEPTASGSQEFDSNLAEHMNDGALAMLSSELMQAVEEDKSGRKKWEDIYKKGLEFLGISSEERTIPWKGAASVSHPMVLEAVVRYQSRALVKMFPQDGPTKLTADLDGIQAVDDVMVELAKTQRRWNRYLVEKMPELRDESDRLLFSQAEIGYAVKKVYFHDGMGRVTAQFVPAENFLIPYGYPNLETCPRYTEVVKKTPEQVKALQRSGFYRKNVIVGQPVVMQDQIEATKSGLLGQEPSQVLNELVKLYEIHVDTYIPEDEHGLKTQSTSPYIVTIEESSLQILSIRRGWREADPSHRKRAVFVPYAFVPSGDGSYAYGYIHLIGQNAATVTKVLRQLLDAGTLANLPGGFKSKFAKMTSQGPIAPGEWRDVEMSPEELQQAFKELPYKEPSQTLLTLMQGMIDEGKSFSSTADLEISASSQNAPVGTTLALLERQMEVANAVQLRLHDSFRRELALIVELMAEYQPDVYESIFGKLESMVGGPVAVYPVGDPTAATLSQRVIQLQSVLQLSAQAPQVFNLPALFRTALSAMGIEDVDTLVPDTTRVQPMDPVQETMAILTGKPVKAFEYQDHDAHLMVHGSLASDPYYQQQLANNPAAMQIMGALQSHIAEHLAFQFRAQVEKQLGVPLPPLGQMPPQVESMLSSVIGPAVQQVVQQHAAQAQQQAAQQSAQDPAMQIEQANLQIKAQDVQQKHALEAQKLQLDREKAQMQNQTEIMRIQSQERQSALQMQQRQQTDQARNVIDISKHRMQHDHEAAMTAREMQDQAQVNAQQHAREVARMALDHMNSQGQQEGQAQQADLQTQQAQMQAHGGLIRDQQTHEREHRKIDLQEQQAALQHQRETAKLKLQHEAQQQQYEVASKQAEQSQTPAGDK